MFVLVHWLCPNSGSASFRGAFEGQLRHNAARRLFKSEGSSKCGLLFPLFGGCTATVLRCLTYPKILCAPLLSPENKTTTAKTSGADLIMRTLLWVQITSLPLQIVTVRTGTSGDATRKYSKG